MTTTETTAADVTVILEGIVGSTAYGLAGPGSDVDRLGVFAAPTTGFHGLHRPPETHVRHDPDRTVHEAGKFARLALNANPTVTELLWLPDDLYETRTRFADRLIAIRSAFLSGRRVRDAYFGYATQQFRKLEARGDGTFSSDVRTRTAKHARHLMRLLYQGYGLYSTGQLTVRLSVPKLYLNFGEQVAAGDLDVARDLMASYEKDFDQVRTPLPDRPDEVAVERWLLDLRAAHLAVPR